MALKKKKKFPRKRNVHDAIVQKLKTIGQVEWWTVGIVLLHLNILLIYFIFNFSSYAPEEETSE